MLGKDIKVIQLKMLSIRALAQALDETAPDMARQLCLDAEKYGQIVLYRGAPVRRDCGEIGNYRIAVCYRMMKYGQTG